MFEVRPIGTRTKFKPVKKPTSEIPSVELVTELVEVELEELRFYVMVSVQYAPLGIADDNVYPWQDFPDTPFVVRNDGMMGGCHPVLFKGDIAAEPVRGHIGIPVRTLLNLARNGGRLEIVDDLHLYMPDTLGRTVLLGRRRLGQTAFRHDKDRGLALASPSALQRAIFLFFRRFRGKEALVNLHVPMEGVTSVALTHHVAQLMHHLPYGLVTLAANLTLYLLGGYGTLGRRQKEHGSKPVTDRQMAALHHRTGTKLHLMFAIHARPGLVARIPAQAQTAALTTEQAVMLTETTKGFLTGCLVGILTVKIKQVHNAYVYCFTFYILHKVFQNMVLGQLGSLNFANLVTCGHSFYFIAGESWGISSLFLLVFFLFYVFCCAVSICAVVFVLLSEMYPIRVRGLAMSIAGFALWIGTYLIGQLTPWMLQNLTPAGTFFLFAAMCIPYMLIVWKLVPETTGKSLEEIERYWMKTKN